MMAPDYAHWHGAYEVARRFYSEYVPQLEALIAAHTEDPDPAKAAAANALREKLDEVLSSDDHKWYIGRMDPAEAQRRRQAAEEFKSRYEKKD